MTLSTTHHNSAAAYSQDMQKLQIFKKLHLTCWQNALQELKVTSSIYLLEPIFWKSFISYKANEQTS